MAEVLQQLLEEANKSDKKNELFSETDLKDFAELMEWENFNELKKGFENQTTIDEIKNIKWLKESINWFVKTKPGLADMFWTEYDKLTKDQDVYEVCVLGSLLEQTKKIDKPDYKTLAKTYYENVFKPAKPEKPEVIKPNVIKGTYATASSEMGNDTKTEIETITKLEGWKRITEASVTISAGADMRVRRDNQEAKKIYDEKLIELENVWKAFTDDTNKTQINEIIKQLKSSDKINEISKEKTDNQDGNRYVVGARIAEGFIQTLSKLAKNPEPKLTLVIDWKSCTIGNTNADKPDDRFININLQVKKVDIDKTKGEKEQEDKQPIIVKKVKVIKKDNKKWPSDKSDVVDEDDVKENKEQPPKTWEAVKFYKTSNVEWNNETGTWTITSIDSKTNTITIKETGTGKEYKIDGSLIINEKEKEKKKEVQKEGPLANVETPEILSLKKELFEHFTINGKPISREVDISNNIVFKDNTYTLSVQWYTWLQFAFETKDDKKSLVLKENTGGIRKWLFLYNVIGQTAETEGKDKVDIKPEFNNDKTIETLNKELESNDQDKNGKADYTVKKINGTNIEFDYEVGFIHDKQDKTLAKVDSFTLGIDANNNIIIPDSQGVGQVSQWKKIEGKIVKDTEFVFDVPYTFPWTKIVYYMQTKVNDNGTPELNIINNIQKTATSKTESVYKEYTEMTNKEFDGIKEDFVANKIERIFEGTLNEKHATDFQNNRKITKVIGEKGKYNFEITFNKNDGKQQKVNIPFAMTVDALTNTRKYTFFDKKAKETVIDNIAYDISTPVNIDGVPSIKVIENKEKTLDNAEKNTSKEVASDIFSGEEKIRENDENKYNVQSPKFSLGSIEFDWKWGYKRTIFFGEQKDKLGNVLLSWEDKGTIYYDKDYKIIHINMKKDGKETELDFMNPKEQVDMNEVLEDENGKNKWVILTPSIVKKADGSASLQLFFQQPEDTEKNRQTSEIYLERIRTEKEIIFTALKGLSTTDMKNVFTLPSIGVKDEVDYKAQKIIWPNGRGLYKRKLANPSGEYLEQDIFVKVNGKAFELCDSDGTKIETTYLIDAKKEDYYEIKIDWSKPKNFSVKKLKEADKNKMMGMGSEEVKYNNGKVAINMTRNTIELLNTNLKDKYTFANNKHEMCTIFVDEKSKKLDESKLVEWAGKIPQIIKTDDVLFWSCKKFFAGNGRENLGISEPNYESAFKSIYSEYSKNDGGKKVIQVKLRSSTDKKYYYDYMAINQKGNKFSLEKLEGMEKAREEMRRRLDNLVLLDKMQISAKWDKLRGVKINTKDNGSRMAYLKDKNSPVKITLTDTTNKSTSPIEITMKDDKKWKLENNKNIDLWAEKIDCTLEFKKNSIVPFLQIEVIEQKNK